MFRFRSLARPIAASVLVLAATSAAAHAGADLVPDASALAATGQASVTNLGDAPTEPTVLTVTCQKTSGGMGGCAEDPGMAAYEDGSYPNAAVIQVPALQPGETFDHVLAFWGALVWGKGTYELTLTADMGDAVAEDDEDNNQATAEKQQLAGVNKTPTPKGPGTIVIKPKSGGGGGFPLELQFTLGQ